MIRPVLGTIITRVFVMLMNIGIIMIAGHRLGAIGLGDISLVVLGITFIMLLANMGGAGLVYLLPRHSLWALLLPSYAGAFFTAVFALVAVHVLPLVPVGTEIHVVVLALLGSIQMTHMNVLLSRQRIQSMNLLQLLQIIVLAAAFAFIVLFRDGHDVMAYVRASYTAHIVALAAGMVAVSLLKFPVRHGEGPLLWKIMRQGGLIQVANFLQLLNYRLAYYLIERSHGAAALGIFSVGNQLAESAWLAPKSIGSVLYGRVSNTQEREESQRLTITAMKAAAAFALVVVTVVVLLPDSLYQWLFGEEIVGIGRLVALLAPGIIAMAISQALSHYYSGTGTNIHNVVGSAIGVLCTLALGIPLIPEYGTYGAAAVASVAYMANTGYQLIMFLRTSRLPVSRLLPNAGDRDRILRLLRRIE